MKINRFKGVGVALVTPFRKDGSIDFKALENFLNFQIKNGIDYLVALGTTSEAPTLSIDEKNAIVDFIIEINNNRVPLVVGCGSNNTMELGKLARQLTKPGVDAFLSVAPYYNKPNQRGLFEHFKVLANTTQLPIILYNVPGRTSSNISAETTLKLAQEFRNIIAVKEASGNFNQVMQIVKNRPTDFLVLSGDDALTLPLLGIGFDGVISVIANAYPAEFTKMVHLALQQKFTEARSIHYRLIDVIESMFEEGSPAGVKSYLHHMGLIENNLRLPLVPVSRSLQLKIQKLAESIQA